MWNHTLRELRISNFTLTQPMHNAPKMGTFQWYQKSNANIKSDFPSADTKFQKHPFSSKISEVRPALYSCFCRLLQDPTHLYSFILSQLRLNDSLSVIQCELRRKDFYFKKNIPAKKLRKSSNTFVCQ